MLQETSLLGEPSVSVCARKGFFLSVHPVVLSKPPGLRKLSSAVVELANEDSVPPVGLLVDIVPNFVQALGKFVPVMFCTFRRIVAEPIVLFIAAASIPWKRYLRGIVSAQLRRLNGVHLSRHREHAVLPRVKVSTGL